MKVLFDKKFLNHNIASNYEGDYRIESFSDDHEDLDIDGEQFIGLIHPQKYIDYIRKSCNNNEIVAEVQLSPETFEAAKTAVGLSVLAAIDGDFAVVRPPGHHAFRGKTSGFCLFNNMAIAAQYLANKGKKVLIVDIDGHHGDGTQSVFYESSQVMFCSIHQMHAFPFTGSPLELGAGEGRGYNFNFPLIADSGDKEFLRVIDIIIKKAIEFKPDAIGISAGFDGYYKDKLLGLEYTLDAFYECGYRLRNNFANVFAILEGGYHEDIHECVYSLVKGVNKGTPTNRVFFDTDMSIG